MNRRQWYTFAALQFVGCALPFVVGHDSEAAVIIAMILLLPGSLVAGLVVGFMALFVGGWDALPVWGRLVVIPVVIAGINCATWHAIQALRTERASLQRPLS
jgi:hypothetical protein